MPVIKTNFDFAQKKRIILPEDNTKYPLQVIMYDMIDPSIREMTKNATQRKGLSRAVEWGAARVWGELREIAENQGGHGVNLKPRKRLSPGQEGKVLRVIQHLKRTGKAKLAQRVSDRHIVDGTKRFGLRKTAQGSGMKIPPLYKALRFVEKDGVARIGFVSRSAGRAARVIQKGLRGDYKGSMQSGAQQITDKGERYMRALFGSGKKLSRSRKTRSKPRRYKPSSKITGSKKSNSRTSPKNNFIAKYWESRQFIVTRNINIRAIENLLGYKGKDNRPLTSSRLRPMPAYVNFELPIANPKKRSVKAS